LLVLFIIALVLASVSPLLKEKQQFVDTNTSLTILEEKFLE